MAVRGVHVALTNCDGSGVDRSGVYILAARHARRVGSLDEVWRRADRADVGGWGAYGSGLDSKWKSTSGIALVNADVQDIDRGRA